MLPAHQTRKIRHSLCFYESPSSTNSAELHRGHPESPLQVSGCGTGRGAFGLKPRLATRGKPSSRGPGASAPALPSPAPHPLPCIPGTCLRLHHRTPWCRCSLQRHPWAYACASTGPPPSETRSCPRAVSLHLHPGLCSSCCGPPGRPAADRPSRPQPSRSLPQQSWHTAAMGCSHGRAGPFAKSLGAQREDRPAA